MRRLGATVATIAWPAFLVAGVLEIAVFAFVDPLALHTLAGTALALSPTAVYSLAFLVFWAATSVACVLTLVLARSADQVNAPPAA